MENINMLIAEKLGEFVMGRLFQNKAHLDNNGDGITTSEVVARLEEIRSIDDYEYTIENTSSYRELMKRCAGSVNFSSDEIVEIGKLVKEAVRLDGIDTNNTYWDVLSFAAKRMDKIMEHNSKDSEIYEKALKYKECLNLNRVPLYYKPFACVIACGYPHVMLRIDTFDSKTIYKVSRNGEVLVDEIFSDMFLDDTGICMDDGKTCNEEAIDVAVDWWAKAIIDPTFVLRYDPNASYLSSVLAMVASLHKTAPDAAAMESFKECLADEIRSGLENNGSYTISVNCRLDPVLDMALQKSHLGDVDYSWDTSMNISSNEVSIALGRGEKQVIFDGNADTKATGVQKIKV